ncbi:hypothetical protein ACFQ6E_18410 [Streptomyces sp. NPDC056462]|uniref:hypothetical protein n=1 Tax=Streptomyces sp. NPDC056462 TaxID=3345826 RepID=UPI0036BC6D4D
MTGRLSDLLLATAAALLVPAGDVIFTDLAWDPALPVVLGFVLLREPLTARRVIGLTGAAVATVLLTLG